MYNLLYLIKFKKCVTESFWLIIAFVRSVGQLLDRCRNQQSLFVAYFNVYLNIFRIDFFQL